VRGLSIGYGGKCVLDGVDLDVRKGAVTALIGPSGCGKTSFLMSLNRLTELVPRCSVAGRVRLGGRELDAATDTRWLRRRIGMVFQRPTPFPVSVARNLHLPLRDSGCPRSELRARTEAVLRRVGLWDEVAGRIDSPADTLSGGQQQRLCIARALVLEPEILLMDEPCSALDPLSTRRIEELIRSLRGTVTMVIVTHNLGQARRLADDVAVFWSRGGRGALIESGPAKGVFSAPAHPDTAAYLEGLQG